MSRKKSGLKILKNKKLILLFLAGLILSYIIFGPVISKFKSRLATNKTLKAEQLKLNTKLEFLEGIDRVLIGERVSKMETVFPSKKPVVSLMGALSSLSREHNLSFGGITLKPGVLGGENEGTVKAKSKAKKTTTTDLRDLKFGFNIGGDFNDVALFMKDLERVAPLMKIGSLGLSIKTNPFSGSESLNVIADVEVLAYFQAPPKTLGSVNKPVELLDKKDELLLNELFSFKRFEAVLPVAQTGKVDLFSPGLQGSL